MNGASIVVDVDVGAAAGKLDKLNAALVNPKPLMSKLGEYLLGSTKDRFKTMQAPDGTPWAPLKPSYLKGKKQNKDKILTLHGYLRGPRMHYQLDGNDAVLIGSNAKYARIHQLGGVIDRKSSLVKVRLRTNAKGQLLRQGKSGPSANLAIFAKKSAKRARESQHAVGPYTIKIPARPFLGLSREDRKEVTERTNDWIGRQLK